MDIVVGQKFWALCKLKLLCSWGAPSMWKPLFTWRVPISFSNLLAVLGLVLPRGYPLICPLPHLSSNCSGAMISLLLLPAWRFPCHSKSTFKTLLGTSFLHTQLHPHYYTTPRDTSRKSRRGGQRLEQCGDGVCATEYGSNFATTALGTLGTDDGQNWIGPASEIYHLIRLKKIQLIKKQEEGRVSPTLLPASTSLLMQTMSSIVHF